MVISPIVVSMPSEPASFSSVASASLHLALLQFDVALAPVILRQRDLTAARLRRVQDAVAQRLLAERLPARRAGRRKQLGVLPTLSRYSQITGLS